MSRFGVTQLDTGLLIPATQRIKLFSPEDWEIFVEEWLTTKKSIYHSIERLGGAGDQGRDVVGYFTDPNNSGYSWDNFQCKHYDHALRPSDVWCEFGKVCYFTFLKKFPPPKNYYFVAPYGVGTSLSNLFRNPKELKQKLKDNWGKYCRDKITQTHVIELDGDLLNYIEQFDFSIFDKITPLSLVEEHQTTRFHVVRFGGGLPERPRPKQAPQPISNYELPYIKLLLKAYSSDSDESYININCLKPEHKYKNHLLRTRENFHQAEQLKLFSRDVLPPGAFEGLKDEIYSGVVDIVEDDHKSGFACVKEAEKEVRRLSISANPLSTCSNGNDRVGVCHHLANEGKFNWNKDENE